MAKTKKEILSEVEGIINMIGGYIDGLIYVGEEKELINEIQGRLVDVYYSAEEDEED